jgi:hypothetical protein
MSPGKLERRYQNELRLFPHGDKRRWDVTLEPWTDSYEQQRY